MSDRQATVLYDVLGPRGRRRVAIATVVSVLLLAGLVAAALVRIGQRGQLDSAKWSYVTDAQILRGLFYGLLNNLRAAAIAGVLTLVIGLVLALGRVSRHRAIRVPAVAWIEFFRGFPLVLLILFPALLFPVYLNEIAPLWYLVIGLTLYNSAVVAEIYRAGILSLDSGQSEAAKAIGLRESQAMRLVILPQAIRRMVPLLLTQLIILFKDSSLGTLVSYPDALRRGQTLGTFEPRVVFQALVITAVLFFLASFAMSRAVAYIERRQRRAFGRAGAGGRTDMAELDMELEAGQPATMLRT